MIGLCLDGYHLDAVIQLQKFPGAQSYLFGTDNLQASVPHTGQQIALGSLGTQVDAVRLRDLISSLHPFGNLGEHVAHYVATLLVIVQHDPCQQIHPVVMRVSA